MHRGFFHLFFFFFTIPIFSLGFIILQYPSHEKTGYQKRRGERRTSQGENRSRSTTRHFFTGISEIQFAVISPPRCGFLFTVPGGRAFILLLAGAGDSDRGVREKKLFSLARVRTTEASSMRAENC